MDFTAHYTEEQEEFRREVAAWMDENVPPSLVHRTDWGYEPSDVYLLQRDLGRRLGARGWLFPTSPVEFGGGGLDTDAALVVMEELGRRGIGLPPYYDSGGVLGSVAIQVWGTDEQKRRYLPPIYRGEVRTWQLLTEPNAGSDLAGVQATAVRDGDEYVIRGEKIYVGSHHGAEALWTLVRTSTDAPRHQNLSWFMIDGAAPGITVTPMSLIGDFDKNTVFFDDVRVPALALIGGENNGWEVASTHLELEHGFRSDMVLGQISRRQMDHLLEHCRHTTLAGRRLVDDPVRRDLLCQAHIRFEIQRLWGLRNLWLTRSGQPRTYEGAQAYYFQKAAAMWMNRLAAEVAGPSSLVWSEGVGAGGGTPGRFQALSIGGSHGGGTMDIQRVVMARRIGIGRAQAESGATLA